DRNAQSPKDPRRSAGIGSGGGQRESHEKRDHTCDDPYEERDPEEPPEASFGQLPRTTERSRSSETLNRDDVRRDEESNGEEDSRDHQKEQPADHQEAHQDHHEQNRRESRQAIVEEAASTGDLPQMQSGDGAGERPDEHGPDDHEPNQRRHFGDDENVTRLMPPGPRVPAQHYGPKRVMTRQVVLHE